jgi:probable rRNA maturation factor
MYQIEIQNDRPFPVNEPRLVDAAAFVLESHEVMDESGLTIVITIDEDVQALNREFRNVDAPTDILSFPADDIPDIGDDDEPPYLGDLIIAYPYASAQAAHAGHDMDDSMTLLVVHGTLHLLGYDHDTPENRDLMWQAQAHALRALNVPLEIVPDLEKDE